ncbi:hypothetical protein Pla100_48690 [Neorhodopirellula pilleata]|uniref:Uncharacterized protein n=1 Tax=Neorhodopirellula pilleata TaxID=2714738 RepID=A0A5C5ZXV1_9BACT|nr:hypothetical protein Pla100_48690 [Neorhodopirellula pilleata]
MLWTALNVDDRATEKLIVRISFFQWTNLKADQTRNGCVRKSLAHRGCRGTRGLFSVCCDVWLASDREWDATNVMKTPC